MRDLEDVEVNFDGITYAKGASVLKQLVSWVGQDEFFAGRARLLRQARLGQHRAARLPHGARGHQRPRPVRVVGPLAREGRRHAAAPGDRGRRRRRHHVVRGAAGGSRRVPRAAPAPPGVGGYDLSDGRLVRTVHVELDIDGARTEVPAARRRAAARCSSWSTTTTSPTPRSGSTRSRSPRRSSTSAAFDDSLPRTLVWTAAWDATRDGETPARDFVDLVLSNIAHETDSSVVLVLLRQLSTDARPVRGARAPARRPRSPPPTRLLELARAAEAGSDTQLQLVKAFAGRAATTGAARRRPRPARRAGDASTACRSTPTCAGSC